MFTNDTILNREVARKNRFQAKDALIRAEIHYREANKAYYRAIRDIIPHSAAEALTAREIALKLTNESLRVKPLVATIASNCIAQTNHPDAFSENHFVLKGLKSTKKPIVRRYAEVDEDGSVIGPVHKIHSEQKCYYIEK